jgi:hypothetical protein
MSKIYNTAMGKRIDLDSILLKNEEVIAVGNMKVNARGDLLGAGGKIIKTRDQVMKEYYALNTPIAVDTSHNIPVPAPAAQKPLVTAPAMVADPEPVKAVAPVAAPAPVITPVAAAIVAAPEPVVISPESGLDDEDEGPAVVAVIEKPIEEVLATPVRTEPPVVFEPKEIPVGKPAMIPPTAPPMVAINLLAAEPTAMPPVPPTAPIRGALASAVHATSTVTQEELLPLKKAFGVQRF